MRTKAAIAALAGILVFGGIGVVIGLQLRSPAQVVADASAPRPTTLTDTVTDQAIQDTLVFRGTVQSARQYIVPNLAASSGGATSAAPPSLADPSSTSAGGTDAGAGGTASAAGIVTALPTSVGGQIQAGKLLIAVSGRPVFALPGAIPAYRDLTPGLVGEDVEQLQKALSSLGFGRGSDKPGVFGAGTKDAVRRFYERAGYEPLTYGAPDAVTQAQAQVVTARRALEDAQAGSGDQTGSSVTSDLLISRARQDLDSAQLAYSRILAANGPMVPANEVLFVPQFPVTVTGVAGTVSEPASTPYVSVTVDPPTVVGHLSPANSGQIRAGMSVRIQDPLSGFSGTGVVQSLGGIVTPNGSGDAGGSPYVPLRISCDGLPQSTVGADVQLNMDLTDPGAKKSLTVVEGAIRTSVDGQTYVLVVADGKPTRTVSVATGSRGDGRVAVTPLAGAELRAGDKVQISG